MEDFSQRHGYDVPDAEIIVRHEAPAWLREFAINAAYEARLKPSDLRTYLCKKLMESPNPSNWSEVPNIDGEVHDLLDKAPWFYVYDLIEWVYGKLVARDPFAQPGQTSGDFAQDINRAFRKKGLGWQFADGHLQVRGPEIFEQTLNTAAGLASSSRRPVARHELDEARRDLSRMPTPELTGAVQHAMAALECVARDVTGEQNLTLGEWLKKNPQAVPAPLNSAVEKLWGYASEYGRHVREGRPATYEEAEMVVAVAGAVAVYLMRKA